MTATRHELHRLADAVADEMVPGAVEALRVFADPNKPSSPDHDGLSFVASLEGGPDDLGERHADYLRDLFITPNS